MLLALKLAPLLGTLAVAYALRRRRAPRVIVPAGELAPSSEVPAAAFLGRAVSR